MPRMVAQCRKVQEEGGIIDSRKLFEQCARDVERHATILAIIEEGGRESSRRESVRVSGGELSSPTESGAIWNLTTGETVIRELKAELGELEARIGRVLSIIEKVRINFDADTAEALEMKYIDRWHMSDIAGELHVSDRHARRLIENAILWLDHGGAKCS